MQILEHINVKTTMLISMLLIIVIIYNYTVCLFLMFYLFYKFCKGINIVKTEYYIIYGSMIGAKGSMIGDALIG